MNTAPVTGFPTHKVALEARTTSGYALEVIDLSSPFGGAAIGTGYALLARNGHSATSPLGSWDIRLTLPSNQAGVLRHIDDVREAADLLGVP